MQIRGLDFHVRRSGSGQCFIWEHALLSSIADEDAQGLFKWSDFDGAVELVRFDARGHGKSASSNAACDYEWSAMGQDLLAMADALNAAQFIGGGVSRGCASVLHAALQAPHRMRALVLVAPPTLWEARSAPQRWYRRQAFVAAKSAGQAALAPLYAGAARSNLPPRAQLAALATIPTLIIGWPDDAVHPLASAQELHRLLPESRLFVATDMAQRASIAGRISDFISGL